MEVDVGSEGEDHKPNVHNHSNKISNSNEGYSKPKRQMKTPFQLETLEKAYASDTYPSESVRAELSEKLGLSDRQLQMWFCHRRLKDKKDGPAKKQRKMPETPPPPLDSPIDEFRIGAEHVSDYGSGSGYGSSPVGHMEMHNAMHRGVGDDMLMGRRYYEPSQSVIELKAIACVEAQLGEPLREDGPILGIEFDPLPPDAFGAPIAAEHHKCSGIPYEGKVYEQCEASSKKAAPRVFHENPFLQDQSSGRPDIYGHLPQSHFPNSIVEVSAARATPFFHGNEQLTRDHGFHGHVSRVRVLSQQEKQGIKVSSPARDDDYRNVRINGQFTDIPLSGPEHPYVLSDGHKFESNSILRMDRKRKSGDPRITREAGAHEIRIRKELEKQDMLRKKSEERMKKEMERQENERKKEEERLLRERQRELERLKREEKRENERREKFLQKEHLRAEKMRQKEALRIEREAVRRKAAIEKATARRIARESMELIEDEQLELMEQAVASKGLSSIICLDHDTLQNLESFQGRHS